MGVLWLLPSAMALFYVHGHVDQRYTWCYTKKCMFCYVMSKKKLSINRNVKKKKDEFLKGRLVIAG